MASKIVKYLLTLSALTLFGGSKSCSIYEGYESKSVAQLTRLAPLVVQAQVISVDKNQGGHNATLNVTHVYKGTLNSSQITANGFGSSASCRSEVVVGSEYILFLDVNPFRARFDDISSATAQNSTEVYQEILEGLCCPRTTACTKKFFTCCGLKFIPSKSLFLL